MIVVYPSIDPVAFHVGPLKVHWYGLAYAVTFWLVSFLSHRSLKCGALGKMTSEQLDRILFLTILGILLGGRIGEVLFYQTPYWLYDWGIWFRVWQGGMSFHGAYLIGFFSMVFAIRRERIAFWILPDYWSTLSPIGLGLGRLANFINGELWGRPTSGDWGMIFSHVDLLPRHPSQLYEMFFEGVVLFVWMQYWHRKNLAPGVLTFGFLLSYGVIRFCIEWFREPEFMLTGPAGWLTMGQWLCLPMMIIGIGGCWYQHRNRRDVCQQPS
jgi:phosphatidylglycerol---prolipoprotein diacylglyceryl transferase